MIRIRKKGQFKRLSVLGAAMACCMTISGCGKADLTYENFKPEVQQESSLQPVGTTLNTQSYEGEQATVEETEAEYVSADGRCRIEKKASYFEVYLDYTDGDFKAAGAAYAEAIKKTDLDYDKILEPYLYENIKGAFPNLNGNYSALEERIEKLRRNIPEDYKAEMEGFAEAFSEGETGFTEDGKLSYDEALLMHMIPDCLRGTNCNALSVWGEKTVSGERLVSRTIEWSLGSEMQMCTAHAVTHFKMPEGRNSYTTFCVLGMLDIITAINDEGVFAAILDVGSNEDYVCDNKKCYTYELRYALENMDDARHVGEYMVSQSKNFTYSHNIILTDKNESLVAEDSVVDPDRHQDNDKFLEKSVLRDKDTPLMGGITWDEPDSICVINSFMTKDNYDQFTVNGNNYVRFEKFRAWVGEKDKLTMADVKDIANRETVERDSRFQKLHSENVFQNIIYDYGTGELHIAFTGTQGVINHPEYVKIEIE